MSASANRRTFIEEIDFIPREVYRLQLIIVERYQRDPQIVTFFY